jgi:hypothetical protein
MTELPKSPGRMVAQSAISSILNSGYCEEAVIGILHTDVHRFRELIGGRARFRDEELQTIEFATGCSDYDWALAGTFEQLEGVAGPVDSSPLGIEGDKDLVARTPKTIKEAPSKEDAENPKKALEDQGAVVELQ